MIKEFNLENAKIEGAEVRTRNGRKVRILCTDAKSCDRTDDIVAMVMSENEKSENILRYYSDGRLISDSSDSGDRNKDLVIYIPDPEPKTREELLSACLGVISCRLDENNDQEVKVDRDTLMCLKKLLHNIVFPATWEDYNTELWDTSRNRFIISGNTLFDTVQKKCLNLLKLARDENKDTV